jgi:hypothetical protein
LLRVEAAVVPYLAIGFLEVVEVVDKLFIYKTTYWMNHHTPFPLVQEAILR